MLSGSLRVLPGQCVSFPAVNRGERAEYLLLSRNKDPSLSVNSQVTAACAGVFGVGVWEGEHAAVVTFAMAQSHNLGQDLGHLGYPIFRLCLEMLLQRGKAQKKP